MVPSSGFPKALSMKKISSLLFSILLVAVAFLPAAESVGKVISVEGEAFLSRGLSKKQAITVGQEVQANDKIKTGDDGKVTLDLNGASKVDIGAGSYFKVATSTDSATSLDLFSGKIKCQVNKLKPEQSFTVKTPSAVAGVRGTEFETYIDDNFNTLVTVEEGAVWNADPDDMSNPVVVNAGQMGLMLANGDGLKAEAKGGASAADLAKIAIEKMSEQLAGQAIDAKEEKEDDAKSQRLQELEERIALIDERLQFLRGETVDLTLPEPPSSTPQN